MGKQKKKKEKIELILKTETKESEPHVPTRNLKFFLRILATHHKLALLGIPKLG